MKKLLWLFLGIFLAASIRAQSNAPVRVALITETGDAAAASDLLTVELSKNPGVTLLERTEIDRVYREQGLTAGNQNYLKLGQVLGADGLLLIQATKTPIGPPAFGAARAIPQAKPKIDLSAQLIAVKPGVLLESEHFSDVDDMARWASGFATQLNPVLPKLSVLVQDAVPISIVNLRSAMQSPETQQLERQLTTLTIERLSHERPLFVLERQKMQLLASEKQLQGLEDSAFWNGSYLLDGIIDRNGYSKDTITLSARLTPPKGGAPLAIEVSGSGTNLIGLINQLVEKVRENLKLTKTAAPWIAADEAQKYFEEAKWALKWELFAQAQSAADSAWVLGKQDMDCALIRVDSYTREIPEVDPVSIRHYDLKGKVTYISVTNRPDPAEIIQALHLLNIYEEFGRTLPPDEPKQDSPYYNAGLRVLHKGTDVLRHFYFHPESQAEVREKLADLRAATRNVAAWIGHSPSVRKTYWIEGHIPNNDEIYHDFGDSSAKYWNGPENLYDFALISGRFWQDTPEDCLALYRSLMESPLFVCIHSDLWFPGEEKLPLTAWNAQDKKRVPIIWQNFIMELSGSTNYFLRMEAAISQFSDALTSRRNANADWSKMPNFDQPGSPSMESLFAEREQKMESEWNKLFEFIFTNYDQIVTGREQLLFTGLGVGDFFSAGGGGVVDKLKSQYQNADSPRLQALHDDYSSRFSEPLKEMQGLPTFKDQKEYLANLTPFDNGAFFKVFIDQKYSKAQAAELKPLVEAYRSNMVASATNSSARFFADAYSRSIQSRLVSKLDDALKAPTPQPVTTAPLTAPPTVASAVALKPISAATDEIPANALIAKKFLAFPTNLLSATRLGGVNVSGHRVTGGKLLLDLRYRDEPDTNSPGQPTFFREAAAILDPNGAWTMIGFPYQPDSIADPMNEFDFLAGGLNIGPDPGPKVYLELFKNDLYSSARDAIRRYDSENAQWQGLPFPGQERAQLYAIDNHLYAASSEGIWEILDGGQRTRILASVRRRPAVSLLDSHDALEQPVLFSGKDKTLWAALKGDVFSWDGNDWKPVVTIPKTLVSEISQSMVFFRAGDFPQSMELWRLSSTDSQAALCLRQVRKFSPSMYNGPQTSHAVKEPMAVPLWKSSSGAEFARNPLTSDGASIYLITLPVETSHTWTTETMMQKDRRPIQPMLVCLVPQIPEPLTIPIRLDPRAGPVAVPSGRMHGINLWVECSAEYLFIGSPYLPGVWVLPLAEIRAELDRQIKALSAVPKEQTAEDTKKALLAKYDLNRNGQFDPEEKEAAINDPTFLEFEFEKIDANHNWQLDPDELGYFDANTNRILEPAEQEGLYIAQHILATKALKEFDLNENGQLEQQEYGEFTRGKRPSETGWWAMQTLPSKSQVERLEHYLEGATEQTLLEKLSGGRPAGFYGRRQPDPMALKQEIQRYWANQKAGS